MSPRAVLLLSLSTALIARAAQGQPANLTAATFGSSGIAQQGSALRLGMTVGQPVTGFGTGPSVPLYAELAGFWRWGYLPVLDVDEPEIPNEVTHFALYPSSPNPFSRHTAIRYAIPSSAGPTHVRVRLFDLAGRVVRVLDSGPREPGIHVTTWDGDDESGHPAGGGVYFYRIEAGRYEATRRLVLIR